MKNSIRKASDSMFPSFFDRYLGGDFFSNFFDGNNVPAVNVKEGKNNYKVEVSLPGYDKEDINVEVSGNMLKISANKESKSEERGEDEKIIRQEFRSSSFSRSFMIPENVDAANIKAKEKSGVLTLTLPKKDKAEQEEINKIMIG